jgi:nitroreductase
MDFFKLIKNRRSIRAFIGQPVEEEKINRIIEAANHAPSAGNLQAYVIVVIRDANTKLALSRAALDQESLVQAPVVLAFFAHQQLSAAKYKNRGRELYSLQDASVACSYAQLAAAALGLGSVWVGAFDDQAVNHILKAQADWRPVALLPVGYPAESPAATPRRAVAELARDAAAHL